MNRVWVHSVNESSSIIQVERARSRDALGAENGHGELFAKLTIRSGWEEVSWCVNVNHRHGRTVETRARFDIYINRRKTCSRSSWNDTRFHLLMGSDGQSDMVTDGGPIG